MKLTKVLIAGFLLCCSALSGSDQFALKSNLIGWATTTTNLGIEFGVGQKSTIQVMGYLNPWNFSHDRHFHFWTAQPEYRYWFCQKFNGWFIGVHALGGEYNAEKFNFPLKALTWGKAIDINDSFPASDHKGGWPDITGANSGRHVEGWDVGGGISAGYQWILSKHWNIEASLGVGYVYSQLRYYGRCQQRIDKRNLHYVGPTNAQVSFLYLF